jgi:hypothetical protein
MPAVPSIKIPGLAVRTSMMVVAALVAFAVIGRSRPLINTIGPAL